MEIISKSKKIIEKLRKEGKVGTIDYDPTEMNEAMEKVRREYIIKAKRSEREQFLLLILLLVSFTF